MDKIILNYDYANSTEETFQALQNELHSSSMHQFAKNLDIAGMKNIINLFIKKICTKQYVENVPRYSPGTWMASITMRDIATLFSECVEHKKVSESECQDCLFDLYLAMIRVGPGTSHYEVIDKLKKTVNMKNYLKVLKGDKLDEMVSALKQHTYTPENGMSIEDYSRLMNSYMPALLQSFVENRDDYEQPLIWTAFLDLYFFYLIHTRDVPDELHEAMQYCKNVFLYRYKRNPYKDFPDHSVIHRHIKELSEFVFSSEFPRGRHLALTKDFIENICGMNETQLEAVWDDMMAFFRSLCLCKDVKKLYGIVYPFRKLFDKISGNTIEKNHKLFETWAVTVGESIEKMEHKELLDDIVPRMISDFMDNYKPVKGDEKYWILLLKSVWRVPTKQMQDSVKTILKEKKLKRIWQWKENIDEARQIIMIVENLDIPTDDRDTHCHCGEAVKILIEMLEIAKIEHRIMAEIGRMSVTHMEKRSFLPNYMVDRYINKMNFQKVTEVVPELLKRFEVLITDASYPWHDGWCSNVGTRLFEQMIKAYKTGGDIPSEVNNAIIRILDFCLDDDCEIINLEDGNQTVWGRIIHASFEFLSKHLSGGTGEICAPVLEKILKFRHSDEENLQNVVMTAMQLAGVYAPEVCSNFLVMFYQILQRTYNIEPVKSRWDKFIEVALKDKDGYITHLVMFLKISENNPEMFTEDIVDGLMDKHFKVQTVRVQVMMVMLNVTKTHPHVFVKHMDSLLNDSSIEPMEQHSVNGVLVNVANKFEKFKLPVLEYLLRVLKISKDQTQLSVTLTGLQNLCVKYGSDIFMPHMDYMLTRREEEHNSNIKHQLTWLIDLIDGRSLETVAQDVKDTQDDVVQLDTRLTGTEVAVDTVSTRVDQHDDNLTEIGETMDTVTQRVDFVEKDIDETKIKVEDIDNKTMTNAPKWSRDLTRLMNPSSEHDWRLLAQRLGYSNDDIRAWAAQHDPCMTVLSEWYATHKTREANYAVLTALQEMNRMDGVAIVENAMKAVEGVVEDEEVEYASPPPVFLSYQWGHQEEVKLICNHLKMAGYECWMDIGQMGGGDKLFEKIDNGIRGAKVVICCVSEKYAKSPNCNREVNLSVNLGKPMIPLLMEKMAWPPKGSMGPIFSEYLFVRFFQRSGEETYDNRIWPVAKFQEMLMQLNCYGVKPEESSIDKMYQNWWVPVQEEIKIDKTKKNDNQIQPISQSVDNYKKMLSPDVFISYQWGKQKEIMALYKKLSSLGLSCWMDIFQMGGGDSLYEKIDSGVRGCKVILSCITPKYSLSANCRREVSLADSVKKPIIPLLLEKMEWPPSGPMSMVFTQLKYINFSKDEELQTTWDGSKFDELLEKIGMYIPDARIDGDTSTKQDTCKNNVDTNTMGTHTDPTVNNKTGTTPTSLRPVATSKKPLPEIQPCKKCDTEAATINGSEKSASASVSDQNNLINLESKISEGDVTHVMKKSKSCVIL